MTTARIRPVVLAIACLAFPLLSDAKPGRTDTRRATSVTSLPKANPTGLGTREPRLAYVSVAPRALMPEEFLASGVIAQMGSFPNADNEHTRYVTGSATVQLPDGARLRSLACFGTWDHTSNVGRGVSLYAHGHVAPRVEVGRANFLGGSGKRRLETDLDHVVDNFAYGYEIKLFLDVKADVSGCRIGYEPPAR